MGRLEGSRVEEFVAALASGLNVRAREAILANRLQSKNYPMVRIKIEKAAEKVTSTV